MDGFRKIVPAGVVVEEDWIVNLPLYPHPEERGSRAGSASRVREFAAGRACARQALACLGASNAAVPAGASREPAWPAGFVGSISHTRDYCAAAVAPDHRFVALGIDVEMCMRIDEALLRLVCTERERRWCMKENGMGGCLLFSAKESAFKALYPLLQFDPGFQSLECQVDPEKGTLSVAADAMQNSRLANLLQRSQGAFCVQNGYIFTAVWIARDHQPLAGGAG